LHTYGASFYPDFLASRPKHSSQVTACTDTARAAIEGAGGTVTRVYYTAEGLKGLIQVSFSPLPFCEILIE